MRRTVALLLPLLGGCFATDTRGALCKEDAQCGPGFQCLKDGLAKTGLCGVSPSCPDHELALGEVVFDFPTDYARKASCELCDETADEPVGAEAQDVAYEITAEVEGRYIFRTLGEGDADGHPGSTFPTVLYGYLDSGCEDKDEVVFDVNTYAGAGLNESLIAPYLLEGEVFTVVVDGDTRESPEGTSEESEAEPFFGLTSNTLSGQCPDTMAAGVDGQLVFDATGRGNTVLSSCAEPLSEDYTIGFTASQRGLYSFIANDENVAIALRSGSQCQSAEASELACGVSVVEQLLEEEAALTIVADGVTREGPGSVELTIGRCARYTEPTQPAEPPTSPDGEQAPQVVTILPIADATVASVPQFAPGCRPPDATDSPAVAAWIFTATESALFRFDTSASPVATRLAVRSDLACAAADRACLNVVDAPEDVIDLELTAGETIVVVVETLGGPSDYRLDIQRVFE